MFLKHSTNYFLQLQEGDYRIVDVTLHPLKNHIMDPAIILKGAGIFILSVNIILNVSILSLLYIHFRPLKSNIPMLLVCNTYFNLVIVSMIMLMMYGHALHNNIIYTLPTNDWWCQFRTFISYVGFCALFYSFVLQSLFRFFRIVLYRWKIFQSPKVYYVGILIQWVVSFLCILPNLLMKDYRILVNEYSCAIDLRNIRGLILAFSNTFTIPVSIVFIMYTYIILYTRRVTNMSQQRKSSNSRDLVVVKRIILVLLSIITIGLPTTVLIITSLVTNITIPFSYDIQSLLIIIGIPVASISLIFVMPQTKELFKRQRNPNSVPPILSIRVNRISNLTSKINSIK